METYSGYQAVESMGEMFPVVLVVLLGAFAILVSLIMTALLTFAFCRIFHKAGYCWALGLLILVPLANLIMPFVLAFGDWPVQKELRRVREQQRSATS